MQFNWQAIDKGLNNNEKRAILGPSKAFDTVSHRKMVAKLQQYGIRDHALKIFKSYLEDQIAYVKSFNRYQK